MVFLKEIFVRVYFEKNHQTQKSMKNFPVGRVKIYPTVIFLPLLHIIFKCFIKIANTMNPDQIANIFVLKMPSAFYVCCIYSNTLQTTFDHGFALSYNPSPPPPHPLPTKNMRKTKIEQRCIGRKVTSLLC